MSNLKRTAVDVPEVNAITAGYTEGILRQFLQPIPGGLCPPAQDESHWTPCERQRDCHAVNRRPAGAPEGHLHLQEVRIGEFVSLTGELPGQRLPPVAPCIATPSCFTCFIAKEAFFGIHSPLSP